MQRKLKKEMSKSNLNFYKKENNTGNKIVPNLPRK